MDVEEIFMLKKTFIGVATVIAGLFLLFLILLMTLAFCNDDTKIKISSNLDQYVKDANEYDDLIRLNRVSEFEDTLYYVHPESKKLYRYNGQDEDTVVCHSDMEYAIVYGQDIYYVNENTLYEYSRETGEDNEISNIDDRSWECVTIVDNRVFFINAEEIICSYDISTKGTTLLSKRPAYRFRIYGDNVFYKSGDKKGLYAMNLDGEYNRRIINAYVYVFDIYENYIYITNESEIVRINLETNTYKRVVQDENSDPYYVNIVNGKLYYKVRGKPFDSTVQADLDARGKTVIKTYTFHENCGVYQSDNNHCVTCEGEKGKTTVTIYNEKDEVIQELEFEYTDILNILTFDSYVVIKAKVKGKETYILYDKDYNEIDRIPQSD